VAKLRIAAGRPSGLPSASSSPRRTVLRIDGSGAETPSRAFIGSSIHSSFRYDFRSDPQNARATAAAPLGFPNLPEFVVRSIGADANRVAGHF
jgi:hypothetical protein